MAYDLTVDGKSEIHMTDQERFEVIDKIGEWLKRHPENLNNLISDLAENFGDYESVVDEPCECCGDTVYSETLDLDK